MTQTPDSIQTVERLLKVVHALAVELNPRRAAAASVTLDSRLDRDLGIDSLGRVELLVRLEAAFDVSVSEDALMQADTPRDLLRALHGARGRVTVNVSPEAETLALGAVHDVPASATTLVEALAWHAERHPERPHLRLYSDDDDGEVITYGDLWSGARGVAAGLCALGVKPGAAVVIMLPTGRDYFYSFMGVLMAGAVPVPVYPPGRISQLEEHLLRHVAIVDNCRAEAMIVMDEALRFAQLLRAQAPTLGHVLTPLEATAADVKEFQPPRVAAGDTALLQYTSGSTGMPKGVVLTHANLLANIRAMGQALEVTSADVFVSWLPLYHDMGLIGAWLGSLYHAAHLVVMSPLAFIARPVRWLRAVHRYGATLSAAPNFAFELCLKRVTDDEMQGLDLSTWRQALNGAEAVSPQTVERFIERFKPYGFRAEALMPVYGLAECSVGLAFPPLERAPRIDRIKRDVLMKGGRAEPADEGDTSAVQFPSCGRALVGHQIRVVDAAGRELPERFEGRVQFTGPSATSGYLRAADKNRDLFDGAWLETGDMGYIAAGELYITGRSKDIIIRAGRNIYPEEVEQEVGKIDGIRAGAVAVFASADARTGTERLIVLAETRKRDPAVLDAQRAAINALVTDLTATPADEVVLAPPNTVPKTSSGKIRRSASREIFERGLVGRQKRAVWLQVVRFSIGAVTPQLRRAWRAGVALLYSVYCWGLVALAALPLWMLVMVLPGLQLRWRAAGFALRALAWLAGIPLSVRGLEHLGEDGAPTVIVSNHQSYLDSLVLAALLPRPVSFVAKAELKANFFVRVALQRFDVQFVERLDTAKGAAAVGVLAEQARGAKGVRGRALAFFAEGTFTRTPGLLPLRMGAFEVAVKADRAVTPMALRGTRSVLRGGQWFVRRGAISLTIGAPIEVAAAPGGDAFAAQLDLRARTRAWILAHVGEPDLGDERVVMPGGSDGPVSGAR